MYTRILENNILKEINKPEIIIINGARRVGKTTLLHSLKDKIQGRQTAYFDFTDPETETIWKDFTRARIEALLEDLGMKKNKGVIFFDEIQYFDKIGILLKLFYDYFPRLKIIATGSSSFLFLQNIGDSLAGRKKVFFLYPLTLSEITNRHPKNFWKFKEEPLLEAQLAEILKKTLVFGAYPETMLLEKTKEKTDKLKEIVDSFLFKDLLMMEVIKKPRIIVELSRLLAFQIGSLINPNEIAAKLGLSRDTVLHYLDLLEKFFLTFKVYPYERNLRDVVKKKFKVYFYDLGIRNALIGNFSPLEQRMDNGFLLENAIFLGLKRRIDYEKLLTQIYFWRDYEGKEVDFVLKNSETLGIEVKWQTTRKKISKGFLNDFPGAKTMMVSIKNGYKFCL